MGHLGLMSGLLRIASETETLCSTQRHIRLLDRLCHMSTDIDGRRLVDKKLDQSTEDEDQEEWQSYLGRSCSH